MTTERPVGRSMPRALAVCSGSAIEEWTRMNHALSFVLVYPVFCLFPLACSTNSFSFLPSLLLLSFPSFPSPSAVFLSFSVLVRLHGSVCMLVCIQVGETRSWLEANSPPKALCESSEPMNEVERLSGHFQVNVARVITSLLFSTRSLSYSLHFPLSLSVLLFLPPLLHSFRFFLLYPRFTRFFFPFFFSMLSFPVIYFYFNFCYTLWRLTVVP